MNLNMLGTTFEISAPYAEGHVCSAADARTLNQTRLENISNQLRKAMTEIKGAGDWNDETLAKARELVVKRDEEYTSFGMGRTGSPAAPRDPIAAEARKIATDVLAQKLKERGTTLAAQRKANKEAIEAKIDEFAAHEKIVAQAKKIVAERQKGAKLFDDLTFDTPAAAPAAEPQGASENAAA